MFYQLFIGMGNRCFLLEDDSEDFDVFGHVGSDTEEEVINSDISDADVCVLQFSQGNAKLDWPYLALPAGYSCPAATVCKTKAAKPKDEKHKFDTFPGGKTIIRGKDNEYTCFAAKEQSFRWDVAKKVWSNFDLLVKALKEGGRAKCAELISRSIDHAGLFSTPIFRIHEAGDFFSPDYFLAWCDVAKKYPGTLFYTYTTSIKYWIANRAAIPKNMRLVASLNASNAKEVLENGLRYSVVVKTPEEAKELGLKIDVDDSLACCTNDNFALLLHGQQEAGSDMQRMYMLNKKTGVYDKIKQMKIKNAANREKMKRNIDSLIKNLKEGLLNEIQTKKRK